MRRLTLLGGCVVALLTIAAVSASAASATLLFLKTKGAGVASSGTPVELEAVVIPESPPQWEACEIFFRSGTLTVNGAAKDDLAFPSNEEVKTCEEDEHRIATVHVVLSAVELTSKGKVTVKASVKFERVGPCVYEITKIKGTFPKSGVLFPEIHGVTGKRISTLSNIACAKKQKFELELGLIDRPASEFFESELRA